MLDRTLAVALTWTCVCGCVGTGTFVSKSTTGNLELNVSAPDGVDVSQVRLLVDGQFVGNASRRFPVLFLNRGERTIRAELRGFPAYEEKLQVLGDPNHQVLNIVFAKP